MAHTENPEQSIFDNLYDPFAVPRKKMLPWWVKVFCYLFFAIGCLVPLVFILNIVNELSVNHAGLATNLALYGLSSYTALSIIGIAIVALFLLKFIVAYGLLWHKTWAVKMALIDGAIGVIVCLYCMCVLPFLGYHYQVRLELILLCPYLTKMWRIRDAWEDDAFARQETLNTSN